MTMDQESFFDRKERDRRARELHKQGHKVFCSTLRNQQTWDTGMANFGLPRESRPGYRVGSVYMLTVVDNSRDCDCGWHGRGTDEEGVFEPGDCCPKCGTDLYGKGD